MMPSFLLGFDDANFYLLSRGDDGLVEVAAINTEPVSHEATLYYRCRVLRLNTVRLNGTAESLANLEAGSYLDEIEYRMDALSLVKESDFPGESINVTMELGGNAGVYFDCDVPELPNASSVRSAISSFEATKTVEWRRIT